VALCSARREFLTKKTTFTNGLSKKATKAASTCRLGHTRHVAWPPSPSYNVGVRALPPRAVAASRPAPTAAHEVICSRAVGPCSTTRRAMGHTENVFALYPAALLWCKRQATRRSRPKGQSCERCGSRIHTEMPSCVARGGARCRHCLRRQGLHAMFCYSLRPILLFANTDVSTTKMCLDTSILAKSIIGRREHLY
jgi:hypothetical protein